MVWKQIEIKKVLTRYYVSDTGLIKNQNTGKIMKQATDKKGYRRICLTLNGKKYTKKVHILVAKAFVKNLKPNVFDQVNHKDGNKSNNNYINLEWVNNSLNGIHAYKVGLKQALIGETNGNNLFSEDQIKLVCQMLENKISPKEISLTTNVSIHVIHKIREQKIWKYISKNYEIDLPNKKEKYDKELTHKIKELIIKGYKQKKIINILHLENNQSIYSLIGNIMNKLKREGSTTIEDYYVIDIT